ncbi:MAG: toprim domain-containing protein, partial [bacterium]|nr:toprim domain-containing protein [bacterium]
MYPKQIQRLIQLFSQFPTVGSRTAARFVFHLLKAKKSEVKELVEAIAELRNQVALCKLCFQPFDASSKQGDTCSICQDQMRDQEILCVVEKESDLEALEGTKEYRGLYFILGGAIDPLQKEQRETLRTKELQQRIHDSPTSSRKQGSASRQVLIKEIIIATNPTPEGEATALYLERILKDVDIKLT